MKTTTNFAHGTRAFFAMLAIIALLAAPVAPVLAEEGPAAVQIIPPTETPNEGNHDGDNHDGDNHDGDHHDGDNHDGDHDGDHHDNDDDNSVIFLCHATDGGFTEIEVPRHDILNHTYVVQDNDIIPPFGHGEHEFAGKNWNEGDASAFLANGCKAPVVTHPFCNSGSNLLQNASFETPVAPTNSWTIFPTVANWTISNDGLEIWNKFAGGPTGLASDGDQNAELDGNSPSNISQVITTVPGATYELRYDFSPRAGRDLADNSVEAQADGVTVDTFSADGSINTGNVWTTRSKTFVATSTATTITFKDLGTPNSYGTLIDNTGVCFVAPAPTPTPSCNLVAVSDATSNVTETDGAAKLLTTINAGWTAVIAGANWIWGDDPVAQSLTDSTQTFTKTFVWHGAVGSTTLEIAADNSYVVKLNGTQIGADAGEFNYTAGGQDVITSFADKIVEGNNTLEITVKNMGLADSSPASNPAGLLFKLTVTGADKSCTPTNGGDDNNDGGGNTGGGDNNNNDNNNGGGSNGGGGRSGGHNHNASNGGEVLGASDSKVLPPNGEVLGAVAPVGAPNTGEGGADTNTTANALTVLFAALLGLALMVAPKRA